MAIVDTGYFLYPPVLPHTGDTPQLNTALQNMNASTKRVAFVFLAPRTGTINKVYLNIGAVTLNVASVVRFSLQDTTLVSGVRVPDGTQDQYRDHTSLSTGILDSGILSNDGTDGGVKRSVTAGDIIALVMEFQTFNTGDTVTLASLVLQRDSAYAGVNNHISALTYNGSTWSQQPSVTAQLALEYQSVGILLPHFHMNLGTVLTFDVINIREEAGNRIRLPFKCQVIGVAAAVESGADAFLKVYNAAETEIASGVAEVLEVGTATDSIVCYLAAPLTLEKDTDYFFVWRGELGGNSINVHKWTVPSSTYIDAFPWGANWRHAIRSDYSVNSFTVSTTAVHHMQLIISGIESS